MELTILMPCLNEEETLESCIIQALSFINRNSLEAEILIADNGSTDGSLAIANRLGVRVINIEEKGYGVTLRKGIANSRGRYIIMGDSDSSYDFSNILPIMTNLRLGHDLVMGNRFKGGIQRNAMPFLHKYLGNPILSFLGRVLYKIPIGDFHCGLRGFNREAINNLDLRTNGMEFASEMIIKSSFMKLKISEVPIKLYPDGRSRSPHLKTWSDGWRHLKFLLLHNPTWLFLIPGIFFIAFGLFSTIILYLGPVKIGTINFDIGSMLFTSTLIIIGFQLISFYLFTQILSESLNMPHYQNKVISVIERISFERIMIIGTSILLLGCVLTIRSLMIWNEHSFGDLNPENIIRVVIVSVNCLVLGTQVIFNGFFKGFLKK